MSCDHRIVANGTCRECNSEVTQPNDAFQRFDYLAQGLSLRHEFVGSLKSRVSRDTLEEKKLHLVLSLYGTFFDSKTCRRLSNREKYLKGKVNSNDDLWQTRIGGGGREVLIKLRPFVHEFLREANELFVLHVHTLCVPEYADFVLKLLDPHQVYFGNRVITSKHALWNKTLDLVLAGEREVIILDDRYDAWWPEHRSNLLQITTYSFFKKKKKKNNLLQNLYKGLMKMMISGGNDNVPLFESTTSYSEERKDESVEDGALANALRFLTKVHHNFFNHDHHNEDEFYKRDVRVFLHS